MQPEKHICWFLLKVHGDKIYQILSSTYCKPKNKTKQTLDKKIQTKQILDKKF